MVLKAERRAELADAVADDAHADLPIGDRLPDSFGAIRGLYTRLSKDLRAGFLGFISPGRAEQFTSSRADGQEPRTPKERTS